MKNTFSIKTAITILALIIAGSSFASHIVATDPPPKTANPNYDPNKGILGRPKDEKIIKRKEEPILKNRKNEPRRFQKDK
jgi:hypothetical protein